MKRELSATRHQRHDARCVGAVDELKMAVERGKPRAAALARPVLWHLDLPDAKERAEISDLAAKRHGQDQPGFDHVVLARASHEFTPAEIHAAYERAFRETRPRPPKERHLFNALIELQPLVDARAADLLRMAHWTRRCATPARGG